MPADDLTHEVLRVLYFFLPAYVANMAPVLARGHLEMLALPMDAGRSLGGVRILGDHKTWRGLLVGILAGLLAFGAQRALHEAGLLRRLALVDYGATSLSLGAAMGLGAGLGDAVKSFAKRRVGIEPGESWIGFDQLDFMLGSYLAAAPFHVAPLLATVLALPIVFLGSLVITAAAYWLHLKEAWI